MRATRIDEGSVLMIAGIAVPHGVQHTDQPQTFRRQFPNLLLQATCPRGALRNSLFLKSFHRCNGFERRPVEGFDLLGELIAEHVALGSVGVTGRTHDLPLLGIGFRAASPKLLNGRLPVLSPNVNASVRSG